MKRQSRLLYFLLLSGTIVLGLLSRFIKTIPLFIGDMLYAIMIYFLVRFLFPKARTKTTFLISLLVCYIIETLQLYQADWIVSIRATTLGRLILGQGFLWSDILAYTFGIGIVFMIENILKSSRNRQQKR